ncbi:Uncharacterised protein [Streptococcus macacae NCTC 11558]|uniref:Toxin-antitoxin system, toxin component, MazF family n=1 Tax=Streptococcus macacae NCTC 11558 TaxID=764298 RepID=G5JX16_9STRE|nr:toxin-antitoxin system, toxin component, MazF family [Streptococcus macacae NCTC 11558]SUN79495.1 Uncharacterised protein [Streptococcus macacae NCTC 11558]
MENIKIRSIIKVSFASRIVSKLLFDKLVIIDFKAKDYRYVKDIWTLI